MLQKRLAAPITSRRFCSGQKRTDAFRRFIPFLIWLLALSLASAQVRDPALIEINVTEGDGEKYATGSRAYKGITVQVVDEQGAPVPNARVVFRMPESGPGGKFATGSGEETSLTDAKGRTAAWGIQWNGAPGECRVSVFAAVGKARAGTTATVFLTGEPAAQPASFEVEAPPPKAAPKPAPKAAAAPPARVKLEPKPADLPSPGARRPGVVLSRNERLDEPLPSSRRKWIVIAAGIGGAVGAGLYWKMSQGGSPAPASPAAAASTNPAATRPTIGAPTISIGRP